MFIKFKFNKSLPINLIIKAVGVTTKKNINPIITGETILPSNNPNLNHILFKGVNIFELIKPKKRKTVETIKDQILKLPSFINGNKKIIKKITENTIPKFLLVGNLVFLSIASLIVLKDFYYHLN